MQDLDKQAFFQQLFQDYFEKMAALASSLVSNRNVGEDIAQETFLRAWIHIDDIIVYDNPRAWLTITLKHIVGDYYRLRSKLEKVSKELAYLSSNKHYDQHSLRVLYDGLIHKEDLQILLCFFVDGMSQAEIASQLDITIATCKKRIERAKNRFWEAINREKR